MFMIFIKRIREAEMKRIHTDPDPQHWNKYVIMYEKCRKSKSLIGKVEEGLEPLDMSLPYDKKKEGAYEPPPRQSLFFSLGHAVTHVLCFIGYIQKNVFLQ